MDTEQSGEYQKVYIAGLERQWELFYRSLNAVSLDSIYCDQQSVAS